MHKDYNGEPLAVDGGDHAESFVSWTYVVAKGSLVLADVCGYSNGRTGTSGFGRANKRSEVEANARRIVACVNGCEGINPEAVPDLLEALKTIAKNAPTDADFAIGGKYDYEGPGNSGDDCDKGAAEAHLWAAKIARAAIAKATGNTI